ncbi:hypothetical protein BH23ACT6_BH23ACT6_01870 [soil metagenome]
MHPALRDGHLLIIRYTGSAQAKPALGDLVVVALPPDPQGRPRPVAVKRLTGYEPDGDLWVESDNTAAAGRVDSWTVGALPPSALLATVSVKLPARLSARRRHGAG